MSAANAGKLLAIDLTLLNTRKFILEKDLISAVTVGKPSVKVLPLCGIRLFTPEKGHMSAANVGISPRAPSSVEANRICAAQYY